MQRTLQHWSRRRQRPLRQSRTRHLAPSPKSRGGVLAVLCRCNLVPGFPRCSLRPPFCFSAFGIGIDGVAISKRILR